MDNHCLSQTQSGKAIEREHVHKIGLDMLLSDLSTSSYWRWQGPTALTHLKHQQEDRPIVDNHSPNQTQLSSARAGGPVGRGQLFRPDSIERRNGT